MGGGGSMQHMMNSLRNNKSLLRKRSIFKKERTFLSTKKEYYKAAQGEFDLKKITKEELILLRAKIIKQRKIENRRSWAIVLVVMVPIVLLGIKASYKTDKKNIESIETAKDNYLIEHINDYAYYIEEGDKWIEKKNWNNATYRYEQAVKLFPEDYEANYRLALSYSYSCTYQNKNCEKGRTLTHRLLKSHPEEQNLLELKAIFNK